ncbi:MAG TPA: hypothetical protein DEQ87_07015 [Algoriphagus sp.]|nr:hypothetical protein [Algoriphagus sp.]MAN85419.1 hypothetical protein [Algoriphagus sp.]HAD51861.1 hypothetical protein [Algoriphagus sp.]HAH35249.1 hypothetical protein [Algoriphagus sp.]HAS59943.1 hypothetical protein [Algoriphagus sp.]
MAGSSKWIDLNTPNFHFKICKSEGFVSSSINENSRLPNNYLFFLRNRLKSEILKIFHFELRPFS